MAHNVWLAGDIVTNGAGSSGGIDGSREQQHRCQQRRHHGGHYWHCGAAYM
jgi:hypothetical protein